MWDFGFDFRLFGSDRTAWAIPYHRTRRTAVGLNEEQARQRSDAIAIGTSGGVDGTEMRSTAQYGLSKACGTVERVTGWRRTIADAAYSMSRKDWTDQPCV